MEFLLRAELEAKEVNVEDISGGCGAQFMVVQQQKKKNKRIKEETKITPRGREGKKDGWCDFLFLFFFFSSFSTWLLLFFLHLTSYPTPQRHMGVCTHAPFPPLCFFCTHFVSIFIHFLSIQLFQLLQQVQVASPRFADLTTMQQHRLVQRTLKKEIEGMHAVRIFTSLPKDEDKAQK